MGGNVGGAGNFNPYSSCTVLPYEGIINENYFRIKQRELELSANLEIFKYISRNPFNKNLEYFLGMLIKSKYDGVGRQLDEIDISIALDISGSMGNIINEKPSFKELALKEENGENNLNEENNMEHTKKKDRLTIAKECLFKMIDTMNDKIQMALTTFDTESKLIISLSPKKEIKSISNVINNIKEGGGTDLTVALEGAAECLKDSTSKFKRIIIITDGWDNNSNFMNLARRLNEKNILITILSIDPGANTSLYERICELKGCNYYFILNETDMEKYLIHQFNYICFPVLYDMKINFKSEDADLIRTIGCGLQNEKSKNLNEKLEKSVSNGELINTKSLFPSDIKELKGNFYQEGGLMLLKINPKSLEKNCIININLIYTEIEGNKIEKNFEVAFTIDELKNGVESEEIKKGIACYYYNKFYRKMAKFLNKNTRINSGGPHSVPNLEIPDKKYFDFLSRERENYDMVKIFFMDNYENDINEYQKEYYLKNLDKWYEKCLKEIDKYKKSENAKI